MKEQNSKCYTTQPQGKIPRFPLQCITLSLVLALLVILGVATFVFASDVSDAGYRGQITVSNNGTATTSVSTVFTLNTQSLIDTNKLNSSANDCAIQTAAGADVAFQPSVNSTYPWLVWVPIIGEDETLYQYLYTSGVTGGKIRYFPDTGGMTTADNASMEFGDNFTIEQVAWVDTTNVGANLTDKSDGIQSGIRVYVSASGNRTADIYSYNATGSWLVGNSHTDPDSDWTDDALCYNDNTGDDAYSMSRYSEWKGYLNIYYDEPVLTDTVRGWVTGDCDQIDVDIREYGGSWVDVYQGAWNTADWVERAIGSTVYADAIRMRVMDTDGVDNKYKYVWEIQLKELVYPTVTASGVSSGEPIVRVWADESYLHISIDGVESDNTSLMGLSVIDNSENWSFMQGVDYMERSRIWVDGVLQQDISWEYATTFTDQSGNSHDATPTFRNASSDPNVSANLTSFTGIMETTPPPAAGQTGWDILPSVPASPEGFFGEFDPSSMTFWGSGYISTFSTATGIPLALIVFPYAFGIAIGAGFIAWYLSSGGGKQHNRGSLLAMAATSLIFMLYFVYGAGGVIPGWILLPFAIEVLVFIVWRQTPSPF